MMTLSVSPARSLPLLVLLALLAAGLASTGCNAIYTTDGTKIRRNMPAERIPGKYGPPDIVGEARAGERRYYFLNEPPAEPWVDDDQTVTTSYFYLDRGYKLVITEGRVRSSESISAEELDTVLPLVKNRPSRE